MSAIRVDAWSDLACPWCYVGKARLDKAIEKLKLDATYQDSQVLVNWSAAKDGLQFKNWRWWPNTLHAHRLVLLADSIGKGGEAKERLFKMTYEEGLNISDLEVLCAAADQLGISGGRNYLMSDQGKEEVIKQDRAAKSQRKIDSVPYFTINGTYSFSGAQDAATIEKLLQQAIGL